MNPMQRRPDESQREYRERLRAEKNAGKNRGRLIWDSSANGTFRIVPSRHSVSSGGDGTRFRYTVFPLKRFRRLCRSLRRDDDTRSWDICEAMARNLLGLAAIPQ